LDRIVVIEASGVEISSKSESKSESESDESEYSEET